MLLPLTGWAITGAIFFVKPGYSGAYESLPIRTYPLDTRVALDPNAAWLEVRYVKTVLGEHLLARTASGWQQLDPRSLQARPAPGEAALRALVSDAIAINPSRYGRIVSVDGRTATTDTGARVTLDWNRLALSQRGADTDRIDWLYRVHYLQWTGVPAVDRVAGGLGVVLVLILSGLGAWLFFRR